MEELKQDVKDIKTIVTALQVQGGIHNEILRTHEQRSLGLEERFRPVEETYVAFIKGMGILVGSVAFIGSILGLYKALH